MSITSFDHFIETLEHVPAELQRNFTLMADLDRRNYEIIKRINECVREYKNSTRKEERNLLLKESMDLFDRARGYSDDKIDLATQTYDLVDKHIRRLECINSDTNGTNSNSGSATDVKQREKGKNKDGAGAGKLVSSMGVGGGLNSMSTEPLAVDMPLDPNEPRYCTCQEVSFGEMIACDNKDCPIEWFHFACVDLKTKPKGRWYCPQCYNYHKKGKYR